jgi:hypothetical protein
MERSGGEKRVVISNRSWGDEGKDDFSVFLASKDVLSPKMVTGQFLWTSPTGYLPTHTYSSFVSVITKQFQSKIFIH